MVSGLMPLPLSVLDLSPIPSGSTAGDALRNSMDLARHAEALGLRRYWLAEHHNAGSLACSAPELLIGQIAAVTRTLRVGAGGIMLPNHTPLKVAETFRVLGALFPERIDLGLGRAPGTDPRTAAMLRRSRDAIAVDDFPERLEELRRFLTEDEPPRDSWDGTVRAIPLDVPCPELWLLGSSEIGGGILAAERGLGFAFAHHINPDDAVRALRRYHETFAPSAARRTPWSILTVAAVCAETDAKATRLASSHELAMVRFLQGSRDRPLPSVEEALAHAYDSTEDALRAGRRAHVFVGAASRVAGQLRALAEEARAQELMVLTHVHSHEARKRSYTLLAEALRAA